MYFFKYNKLFPYKKEYYIKETDSEILYVKCDIIENVPTIEFHYIESQNVLDVNYTELV